MRNIIIIGLPGAGKSTLGVILAKTIGWKFLDTDLVIQQATGRLLQEIIDTDGIDAFKQLEEQAILSLDCHDTVIATGGSVVYSEKAMEHLKAGGVVVWLDISLKVMRRRLRNIKTRGIVLAPGESLAGLYNERLPLYRKYADITVDCSAGHFENVVETVLAALGE
ncbi:MAG: shikimate kinase [Methanoregula sp.]